jgi:hypothetical protein
LLAESLGDWLDAVAKYGLGVDLVDVMIQVGVLHRFAIILLVGRAGGELGQLNRPRCVESGCDDRAWAEQHAESTLTVRGRAGGAVTRKKNESKRKDNRLHCV